MKIGSFNTLLLYGALIVDGAFLGSVFGFFGCMIFTKVTGLPLSSDYGFFVGGVLGSVVLTVTVRHYFRKHHQEPFGARL